MSNFFAHPAKWYLDNAPTIEVPGAAIGYLKVSTNGYCGGDSSHGSRTALQMRIACGDVAVRLTEDGFALLAGGDEELRVLIQMLKHAVVVLESEAGRSYEDFSIKTMELDALIDLVRGNRLSRGEHAPEGELRDMLRELIRSDLRKAENALRAAKYHEAELEKLD